MGVSAGLLAATMLVFSLLTASGSLHHALHQDGAAGGSPCAVCLFAKGQVDLPDGSPIFVAGIFLLIGGLIVAYTAFAPTVISLLPPGRAPPRRSSAS